MEDSVEHLLLRHGCRLDLCSDDLHLALFLLELVLEDGALGAVFARVLAVGDGLLDGLALLLTALVVGLWVGAWNSRALPNATFDSTPRRTHVQVAHDSPLLE